MKKILRFLLLFVLAFVVFYLIGPNPPKPKLNNNLPVFTSDLNLLEKQVADHEKAFHVKPDNEARFLWADDSVKEKTGYSLLYLHGFGASWYEGFPVNIDFAHHFNCNAYFARLASHGIDTTEALVDMTPERLWESAKEALVISEMIGSKVIIMATSTGCNLALKLAAEFPEKIQGLILYSPNIRINNSAAFLMSKPWGLQMARMISKGNYRFPGTGISPKECQYWQCKERLEAIVYLQQLVEVTTKKEIFERVKTPVFMGYYYKDKEHQDKIIRIDAALKMFDQLGTASGLKKKQAFPDAADHGIANELFSKSVDEVREATFSFARDVLGMKPAGN